jgi:glycosyltransferase involved in cell wall biosynthesis
MQVLHSGTLDVNAGGPAMSTYLTLYGLRQLGVDAEIIQFPLSRGGRLRGEGVPVHTAAAPLERRMNYAPGYRAAVRALGPYDIYHAQGIWQYPTYALIDEAKRAGRPYIITPRGMLYPQDIAKSSTLFKRLSLRLRLLRDLNRAACVQVTCAEEMQHCRRLGVTAPIAVVPNPVEIRDYPLRKADSRFRLGYLGRISRRKNIEGLIYAFAALGDEAADAELLIIGGGDADYEAFLRREVARLGLPGVRFAGFLSGEEKDRALASCSVLAMPSEFENLGNVVLEGLVRRIPCIATTGSPWEELRTHHCGWWIPYTQAALNQAVADALHTSPADLSRMGENGRRLMEQNYSVESIAQKMLQLYRWILGQSALPEFVHILTQVKSGGGKSLIPLNRPSHEWPSEERRAA